MNSLSEIVLFMFAPVLDWRGYLLWAVVVLIAMALVAFVFGKVLEIFWEASFLRRASTREGLEYLKNKKRGAFIRIGKE